jgi:peptidylprolyl isomerase domain and WD repeat-containing protein 1
MHIYNARGDATPLHSIDKLHSRPIHILSYNPIYDCVVSADTGGMVEYWQPSGDYQKPSDVFEFKSQTDLYDFKKAKSIPSAITFSKDGEKFATQSFPDRQIRIFSFRSGKCIRKYDESITTITEQQQDPDSPFHLSTMTFGARLAADREIEKTTASLPAINILFDESGHFIIYATLSGIKIVNTVTNRMVRLLGKDESHRFTNLAIYQGAPKRKEVTNLTMAASDNPLLADAEVVDPIIFAAAFRKTRFFMFTTEPDEYHVCETSLTNSSIKGDRDVYNEKPTRDDRAAAREAKATVTGTNAVMHTTLGDIFIKLFPNAAPKAVENFCTHAKNGYYDGTIFHRVIPKYFHHLAELI